MKYKVFNNNGFNVAIRFENESNREVLVRAKSFVLMTEDDILYTDAASTLFEEGVLFVEEQDLNEKMGYIEKNANTISDEDIKKIFALNNNKMKQELEKITSKHAIDKIVAVAKDADLPTSKLKLIKEQFNVEIFEDIDSTVV